MKKLIAFLALALAPLLPAQKFEGLAPTPPMGWNSWNTFQGKISETLIKEMEEALVSSGRKALGDYLHSRGFQFGIHNCAGTKTCAGLPGGRGHEFQDARSYASWGV